MLFDRIGASLWIIVAGIVVEPPAALTEAINKSNARLLRLLGTAGHRMSMLTNTLGRYFAGRFVVAAVGVFASIFVLLVLVDYIEMVRRTSGLASASAIMVAETSLFRVPQLLEKMMPFCILIGAMTCYLALSRRLELVVARAAGVSAWQFISPALACALAARRSCDHRLQSDVRQPARTLQADGGRTVRLALPAEACRMPPASGSTR